MTVISTNHDFVFVHLKKCGGTSVEQALESVLTCPDLVIGSTKTGQALAALTRDLWGVHKHSDVAGLSEALGPRWEKFTTVAVVRDPVQIYESFYRFHLRLIENYCTKHEITREELLKLNMDRSNKALWNSLKSMNARFILKFGDFNKVMEKMIEKGLLEKPLFDQLSLDGKLVVDHIYRLEDGIDPIAAKLSELIGKEVVIGHENKGASVPLEWADEHLEAIRRHHARDFEYFDYG